MNSSYYKCCAVPLCKSTTIKTPNKLFIYVPNKKQIRRKWLKIARRKDARTISNGSPLYFCEDHFDLPNDMSNYMEYHIMGKVSQVRMKPDCVPKKFECQKDLRKKRTCSDIEQPNMLKKQRMSTNGECLNEAEKSMTGTLSSSLKDTSTSSEFQKVEEDEPKALHALTVDKSVQALVKHNFRSKAVQTKIQSTEKAVSPLKPSQISVSTSPFKQNNYMLYVESASNTSFSPVRSLKVESSSDYSEFMEEDKKLEAKETILNTIKKIENKPLIYIGVPKKCYYLIDILSDKLNIPKHHLLFCLNKIRLNSSLNQLSDDYAITPSCLSKIFSKNIPFIARVMRPFIVSLDSEMIFTTLPMAFRHKYHNVSCIIDCLEIEIKKPTEATNQALAWSDNKKANTIKYLISYTPNGLVNYISPGFGGRITDTCIVETCDFVQGLKKGMFVMADRGFKHVEQSLRKSGVTLVRPPRVETDVKMSKTEAKLTKQIASLRIHVEQVTQRLREFCMLKPYDCIHSKYIKVLDDIIIIACALINLQDSIIE